MTTRRNDVFGKKLTAVLLCWSLATGMTTFTPATQAQAAPVSMFGDEIIDVAEQGATLTVKDETYTLAKILILNESKDAVLHDTAGNIYLWLINGDLKVCNYSLQGKAIKPVLLAERVVDIKSAGEGQEKRLTDYVTASGEKKSALSIDEAKSLLLGSGSGTGTGSTNNGTNGGTNQGNSSAGNGGTNTGTGNNGNAGSGNNTGNNGTGTGNNGNTGSGTGNGTTTGSKISLIGNDAIMYKNGDIQKILSAGKTVDKHIELGNLFWVRFADGQISFWDLNQTNPTEVIIIEKRKSSSILLQDGKACYYDTNGVLQTLTTTPVTVPTQPSTTPTTPSQTSKISLIGNDAIMYKNGDTQKILSSGKTIDKHIELGNLFWVRFADGQISFWDLNQTNPTEVIIIEKGKSSSILLQDGKACYYDTNGVLQTLTTTPVTTPTQPSTPSEQPTTPTQPTTPSVGDTSTATKFTYAYRAETDGIYTYLYNSKNEVVDKFALTTGVLKYSGKNIKNWKSIRWAKFNKEGNIIVCLKNAKYYSVNHNTLAVKKLGTKAKDRNLQRGLITHVIKKNGSKKNVAHK